MVIWGAHGGAGTSTLAVWLQPARDTGGMRPEPNPPYPADLAHGRALVVVCRNTAWATAQATKAVTAVTSRGGQVAVLAVVGDGWPEPATAARRFRLLETQVGTVIRAWSRCCSSAWSITNGVSVNTAVLRAPTHVVAVPFRE